MNPWLQFLLAVGLSALAFLPVWLCDSRHEACRPKDTDEPKP